MADLNDLRKKYPQYSDMSDQEFADAFYKKYYSDIPKDDFYNKINFSPKVKNIVSQPQSTSTWLPTNVEELAKSPYVQATLGIGDKVANLMSSGANLFGAKLPYRKSGEGTAYEVGKFAGDLGSYGLASMVAPEMAPEFLSSLGASAKGLPYVGKLVNPARRAAGAAAFGSLEDPENRAGNAGMFGAISLGADALSKVIPGIGSLRPSRYFRGNLSPEELAKNLEVTKGTNTNLGDVVGSPFLKRQYENILSKIPGSGVEGTMQKTAEQVKNQGNELLNKLLGSNEPENVSDSIHQALKDAQKEAYALKNQNYKEVNDISDKLGIKIGRENLSNSAKEILEEVNASPELLREISPDILKDLQSYANPENVNNLKLSNIFKGKLNDKSNDLYVSGKSYESGIYKRLKDSLQSDIDSSINKEGNESLKQKYDKAQEYYRKNIAPFEEPEITKFTREGGDPDLIISHFVKKGINDRSNLIDKLLNKLPESKKGLLSYGYLSRSLDEGELNPLKLKALYKSLGPKQRESLINDKNLKGQLDKYTKLVEMNTEPLTSMFNAKTGQRNLDIIPLVMSKMFGGTLGGIGGGYGGYQEGGVPGAIAGALGGIAIPALGAKYISKKLTSPEYREKLVKKMIENSKPKKSGGKLKLGSESLAQAIANMSKNKTNGNGAG